MTIGHGNRGEEFPHASARGGKFLEKYLKNVQFPLDAV
jgi:hypothetical protein